MQRTHRRVEHKRRGDGFEEDGVESHAVRLAKDIFAAVGGDQNAAWRCRQRKRRYPLSGLYSVQVRHPPVEEHDRIRVCGVGRPVDRRERLDAGGRFVHAERHGAQHLGKRLQREGIVVDHEEASAPHLSLGQMVPLLRLASAEPCREEEHTPSARLYFPRRPRRP